MRYISRPARVSLSKRLSWRREPFRLPPERSKSVARFALLLAAPVLFAALAQTGIGRAADAPASEAAVANGPNGAVTPAAATDQQPAAKKSLSKDPPGMKRLQPEYDVWIDPQKKRVVMDGVVCLREGNLEMFVCLRGTKEHESVISVDVKAYVVHAALMAVGAKPGSPVKFQPQYEQATGTPIDITLIWTDEQGVVQRQPAQQWVRNSRTKTALDTTWVFAGSGFFTDETTGQQFYKAEGGDFICVSNFPDAMLDLPIESSQVNQDLLFDAFTEHIPQRGTRVRLVLTPRLDGGEKK